MTIENLVRAVPPPERPGDPFPGPWREIEAKLGTALPADYKAFVQRYGLGYFMEYLWVWTPQAYDPKARLEAAALNAIKAFREDEYFAFPLWPASDGLLPFGVTIDGDYLAWVTRGPPDTWSVSLLDRGAGYEEAHAFDCDMTDFLAGLATGAIGPPFVPDDMLPCENLFIADPRESDPVVEMRWRLGPFGSAGEGSASSRLGRR